MHVARCRSIQTSPSIDNPFFSSAETAKFLKLILCIQDCCNGVGVAVAYESVAGAYSYMYISHDHGLPIGIREANISVAETILIGAMER